MIERMRNEPRQEFAKGDLVTLRDDVSPSLLEAGRGVFEHGVVYRVLHYSPADHESGASVWLGPIEMSEQDVAEFTTELAVDAGDPRYIRTFPVSIQHLRKATIS